MCMKSIERIATFFLGISLGTLSGVIFLLWRHLL